MKARITERTAKAWNPDTVLRERAQAFYLELRKAGQTHRQALNGIVNFVLSAERLELKADIEAIENPGELEAAVGARQRIRRKITG